MFHDIQKKLCKYPKVLPACNDEQASILVSAQYIPRTLLLQPANIVLEQILTKGNNIYQK